MRHMLYIPTNRECGTAISRYLLECKYIQEYTGEETFFLLIESNDFPCANSNSLVLKRNKTDVNIIDFTLDKQNLFLERLLSNCKEITAKDKARLLSLLQPQGVCYGAGPNKAALLAAALNISVLHRRDSDTIPCTFKGENKYPSKLECDYILSNHNSELYKYNGDIVYFIGSNYLGEAPIDYEELMEISPEYVYRIKKLENPSRSLESIVSRVHEYFSSPNETYDGVDIVKDDITGLSEMGNCCVAGMFLHLPEMPMKNILGCDYMQKNVLYRLNYPILYHNRKVDHAYTDERDTKQDIQQFIDYNLRDVRFKLIMRIRNRHNAILKKKQDILISEENILNIDVYVDGFVEAIKDVPSSVLASMIDELVTVYREIGQHGNEYKYRKYSALADELSLSKEFLISDIYSGIDDYCYLIKHWKALIDATSQVDCSFLMERY